MWQLSSTNMRTGHDEMVVLSLVVLEDLVANMPLIHGRPLPTFCQGGRVEFRRYVASSISSKNIPRYYQAYKLIRDSDLAVDNVQNGRIDSNGQTWPTTFERF
jgi:hypothetical protein